MNATEIAEAIEILADQPFDAVEFPYAFLEAFGRKPTEIKRLRSGNTNKSDLGGVLQRNHIHIAVAAPGEVTNTLTALRDSPATAKAKAKFILATDGDMLEAQDLTSGDILSCPYPEFAEKFGFFLPLAGITTIPQLRESSFDIRATRLFNKLYLELLQDNPDWDTAARRADMNHFMARLIFCFYAEDTSIFHPSYPFTGTVEKMSERDSSNTHEVIAELFCAMNTRKEEHEAQGIKSWARPFPYVNGGLFGGSLDVPRFNKSARNYLIHIGGLNWTKINPDIFGSMIQAVADDEERGALGMHYTSVPNILKVLNPLFLDDLRSHLEEAGDNKVKLLNLRKRMAKIRVFDPACGSGNFLVIAYKEMRKIEAEINQRRDEADRASDIPLTNFRGIELRDFPAEIARLALIIAEFQSDVLYRGQKLALAEFLPLDAKNWIVQGNALRLDWLTVCEPTGKGGGKIFADDLYGAPLDQAKIDFENEGGETYICGNPPYLGSTWQDKEQKADLERIFGHRTKTWKSLDYVAGWFMKAADYGMHTPTVSAFVSTNSICQGQQVAFLWPMIFETGHEIAFAFPSFKWANLASHNAGVTVSIVAISNHASKAKTLFSEDGEDASRQVAKSVDNINAYLVASPNVVVAKAMTPLTELSTMDFGNKADDGGHLTLTAHELEMMNLPKPIRERVIRRFFGSKEFINGEIRYCIWVTNDDLELANSSPPIERQIDKVREARLASKDAYARSLSKRPHQFKSPRSAKRLTIVTPRVSSENRPYLPVGLMDDQSIIGDRNFALYDAPLWNMALIASRLHWVWIGTVCVRMRTDFSYSNTLGWNTFPVPPLTEKNKADLTRCAENILLAREAHFPATIADLYDPDAMPENLRAAHDANDEVLERIYIGRRFKNDTERLEKLFELYTKMTGKKAAA
jgi:hypothetical protein